MKKTLTLLLLGLLASPVFAQKAPEAKAGWLLGAQSYSFRLYPFAEALRKIDSCGLKNVEAFPGQNIGGGIEGKMDFKMNAATRESVKKLLKERGITLTAYGVVSPKDEADWKALFEFAKEMGVRNINAEPPVALMPTVGKLAKEYKIHVAIHNHPKPSHYWHPDSVLAVIGDNPYLGSCADIGHWVRSGLNPVECLKKLEGHVIGMHFKDLAEKSPKTHDVVWGTGVCDIPAVQAEMKRQKFKGPISAEYEYHWENNGPEILESVKNFRTIYTKGSL
ncbi:sugar phosphate isomerase/epimerase family protein [Siphonobacter aquaeclarae]|jgi:sugar phosphate isomerase/epimerase|uniref:Sugar phosphate isomerase/epimerase n=1 Tax=Siphonobacter aquaeclarae TaxID=563176 RepID=A0A1G9TYP2_9BACT|nr:sugar phosphate isomerase/epimerase [Siphonobacter aquaeclarae]MBO9638700.1 sugar phosphate isomerase/epimerase [Siphonobacter aquaeclarae]SDM52534.1 Sugar phosphate isomerase/epimerase [Siphonobacter aquaeclarae]